MIVQFKYILSLKIIYSYPNEHNLEKKSYYFTTLKTS